jgi:hypothetical protein
MAELPTLPPLAPKAKPEAAPALPATPPSAEPATRTYEVVAEEEALVRRAPVVATTHDQPTRLALVPQLRPAREPASAREPERTAAPVAAIGTRSPTTGTIPPPPPPSRKRGPRPSDEPAAAPTPPSAGPAATAPPPIKVAPGPASLAPAPEPRAAVAALPWKEPPPRKRQLPRKARIGLGVAGVVVVLMLASRRCGGGADEPAPQLSLQDDLVVHEADLKKRREILPSEFAPRPSTLRSSSRPAFAGGGPAAAPAASPALADLQAQRASRAAADEEDLRRPGAAPAASSGARRAPASDPSESPPEGDDEVYAAPTPSGAVPPAGRRGPQGRRAKRTVVKAGQLLHASLDTPIELSGGAASVVASISEGPLAGARLVGSASLSGQRVTVRFRRLILADGLEVPTNAEAMDADGAFGLAVAVPGSPEPSVGQDVARETATDVVVDTLGAGVLGSAARSYARKSQTPASGGNKRRVTVGAGREIDVFWHEAANAGEE